MLRRRRASEPRSGAARFLYSRSFRFLYEGKAIWNVFIDSLFLNALPVPMLATGFFEGQNGAKTLPRRSKTRQDVPRCAKMRPRGPQVGPRRLQDAQRSPQEAPGVGKWRENGGKMEPSWHQNGAQVRLSSKSQKPKNNLAR